MLRPRTADSILRTIMLALLWALLPAGCAYAQSNCFDPLVFNGTLGSWLGQTCTISGPTGTVTYTWNSATGNPPGYACQSNPTTLCPTADQITVSENANGCSDDDGLSGNEDHSILWVQSDSQLNVSTPGDYIAIAVNGRVSIPGSGNHSNWNWPHFDCQSGQSLFGTEVNETDVDCGSNCTQNANMVNLSGISTIPCNANDNGTTSIYCTDYVRTPGAYNPMFNATFSGSGPYDLTIKLGVKVPSEQSGSAFLYSLGAHLEP
jgi:hypothetical protein